MKKGKIIVTVFAITALVTLFFGSKSAFAQSTITSEYTIDGYYVTGNTSFYARYVTGRTTHVANSAKEVDVTGYYLISTYPVFGCYGTSSDYSPAAVYASPSFPSGVTGCGSKAVHTVIGSTGSWSGTSYSGYHE